MFTYARTCLTSRRAVWFAALPCALIAALPAALAATALAPSVVTLVLTGDVALAIRILPRPTGGGLVAPWVAIALAGASLGAALYSRFYAMAVWSSDDRNEDGWGAARRATQRSWRSVLALNLLAGAASLALLAAIVVPASAGNRAAITTVTLVGLAGALAVRCLLRVMVTLAVRHAVLEECRARDALLRARSLLARRRHEAVAAWSGLVALGGVVWIGGRLVSPVLQDTAFDYPSSSAYAVGRETAQLLVSVPLEALLIAAAVAVWTAVWRDEPELAAAARREPEGRRNPEPWAARALGVVLVLAVVGNAIPTALDAAYAGRQEERAAAIATREIAPEDALRRPPTIPRGAPRPRTAYAVRARLRGSHLTWTTTIDYPNRTGRLLADLGIHIYPAAYDRDVGDIPFARDLIAGDLSGTVRAEAESGTLDVQSVQVDGRGARFSLAGTALTVRLGEPLQPHDRVHLEISLDATLPTWPERYGLWRDKVLLGNWIPTVAVREGSKWRLDPFSEVGDPFYSEIADYDIRIEAADHLGAVGSGVLQSVTPGAPGTRLWRFTALASRDAAVAVAPFMRGLATVARGTVVRSWYSSPQAALGSSNLADAAAAVRDYTRRFGAPAHDEVEVLETEGFLGGMEYPGLIFTSSVSSSLAGVPLLSQLIDHVGFESAQKRYVIGHEVAHQWWYATVGNDQVREPWLDEAFAEMSTRSWLQRVDGSDLAWRVTTGGVSPEPRAGVLTAGVGDFSSNPAYSDVVYAAGAEVLSRLRDRIGGPTFDEVLRAWYREQRLGIGSVEEFMVTVGRVAGPDAESFLRRFD